MAAALMLRIVWETRKILKWNLLVQRRLLCQKLQINLPNGEALLKDFKFNLQQGESLLIAGPSGCGKSTLIRSLAGIWPLAKAKLLCQGNKACLFLPQKTYLPLGTLRESLLYPYPADFATDDTIRHIMELCKLSQLVGKLDEREDWSHMLSLGEQQKIAFVRG